tara:strand:+ start:89504 stop:89929 length:426 start_codon:yes stop_codon:yes gene_type:complete
MKSQFILIPKIIISSRTIKKWFGRTGFQRVVVLETELDYYSELLGDNIVVPSSFISDGASVPKMFWNIYPPFGKYLESALVHDYYYHLGRLGKAPVTKSTADKIFREAMKVQGVGIFTRNLMYRVVSANLIAKYKTNEDTD